MVKTRNTLPVAKFELQRVESAPVATRAIAARPPQRDKRIHARRIIPKVARGEQRADPAPTLACQWHPAAAPARRAARGARPGGPKAAVKAATGNLVLAQVTELGSAADNNAASNVCEPSAAANGDVVFYTGNWFAAVSTDAGASFQFVDPVASFPDPPGLAFCCDQVVHYVRKIDTFVWLLQYINRNDDTGANIQRLAFATTAQVRTGQWRLFDIRPQDLGLGQDFLDFPDLAWSNSMLYMTTNSFSPPNAQGQQLWHASVLVRIPLASIRNNTFTAQFTTSTQNFSFRVAQHCTTRAFFASHQDTSTLRVFSWGETQAAPTFTDVHVASWDDTDYRSMTPGGGRWLDRADPRHTGATKARSGLWFAWGAGRGGANNRPHPYVQIARINPTTMQLAENINLWHPDCAICYAALSTNANSEVGASYAVGGGTAFPSHAVGILTGTQRSVIAAQGARAPGDRQWGDYLTVRRGYPNTRAFAATGFVLKAAQGGVNDATPVFVRFGRTGQV